MESLTPEQQEGLAEVRRLRMEGIKAAKKLRNDDAEALYRQSLQLHEQVLGETHPALSESLGQLVFFCGRHARHFGSRAD